MSAALEEARLARCNAAWPVKRLRHITRLVGGGTPSKGEESFWSAGTIPWVSPKDMKARVITETEDYITEDAVEGSATSFIDEGSPLMVVRSGILRHTLPVALAGRRLTLNQDMKAFRLSREVDSAFLVWWFEGQSKDLLLEWRQFGATVESIDTRFMMNGRIALPPLATQKAIAAFLDRETARIDKLIAKKERQVNLLAERQSTIIEVATEHPKARLSKLGHHIRILPGYAFPSEGFQADDNGVRLLRGVNIAPGAVRWDDVVYWPLDKLEEVRSYLLRAGDIVFGMDRPWVSAGIRVAEITDADAPSLLLQRVCRITPNATLDKGYLKLILSSRQFLGYFEPIMTGVSVPHISAEQIASFRFRLIPVHDQRRIARGVQHELAGLRAASAKIENSIALLREHRAALITAAVAGQIDIRENPPAIISTSDRDRFRLVVGAEIIHRLSDNPKRARVKVHKITYLAETHLGIDALQGNYLREAAGPLDRALREETERGLEAAAYYRTNQTDGTGTAVTYTPLAKAGQHKAELATLLGSKAEALRSLIAMLADLDRRATEAVATLYAVWNDALIDGETPDDAAIINGVLHEWHTEKGEKFTAADLNIWLAWMRRRNLIPRGQGPRTTTGRLFV